MTSKVLEIVRRQGELVELDHWANLYEVGVALNTPPDREVPGRTRESVTFL